MKILLQRTIAAPLLVTLIMSLLASSLMADELMNITDIQGCRAIKGEAERLNCYDTVAGGGIFNEEKLKQVQVEEFGSQKMPKPPEPKVVTPEPAPAPMVATEQKAAPDAAPAPATKPEPEPAKVNSEKRIYVTIVRMQKAKDGIHYFQTSDGQVWKQQTAGSWSIKAPFEASIKSGVMGSFFLVPESGKSSRVKRVK